MTPDQLRSRRQAGVTDGTGRPEIEPSENVKALVAANFEAAGKFRESDKELSGAHYTFLRELLDLHRTHEKELAQQREAYQEKLARAESGRLDSIRQVDREEVAKTAVSANTAITTLAKQTTDLQQTLAKQVTDTATAQESRMSAQYNDTNKRISALELSSSEGKGSKSVADPQFEELRGLVTMLARNQDKSGGKTEGVNATWGVIVIVATLVLSAAAVGVAMIMGSRPIPSGSVATVPQPIVISVPQVPTAALRDPTTTTTTSTSK